MLDSIIGFLKFSFFVGVPFVIPHYLLQYVGGWMFLFYPIYIIASFSITSYIFDKNRVESDTIPHRGEAFFMVFAYFFPSLASFIYFIFKYF